MVICIIPRPGQVLYFHCLNDTPMEDNWYYLIPIALGTVVLIIWVLRQNRRDKKELVRKLNDDYNRAGET